MSYQDWRNELDEWDKQGLREEFPREGKLRDRYALYLEYTDDEEPKSFEEWLES